MSAIDNALADGVEAAQSKWVERYLTELDRWVPEKNRSRARADVRAQVDAAIANTTADGETTILATLKALGAPQRLALHYGGAHSLIGPLLYPTFIKVLQIVLPLVLALNLFGVFAALGWQQESLSIGGAIVGVLAALFQAAGVVVVIFAVVERFARIEAKDLDKDWNPKSLPVAQTNDRVRIGETISKIVFNVIALVVLAFFLDRVGGYYVPGQGWSSMQIFTDHFRTFVPWLVLWLAADTLLTIGLLARGHWRPLTRILKIGIDVGALAILYPMLTGEALLVFSPFEIFARITVAITLVVTLFDIGTQILRIVRRPASSEAGYTLVKA